MLPGYQATNPDDDIVARCDKGRLVAIDFPGAAVFSAAADRIESASAAGFPSNVAGRKLLEGAKDPWGNTLIYQLIDSSHARISSAGPDRERYTRWDVGLIVTRNSADPPPGMDTWLGRRKAELGIMEIPDESGFTRDGFSGGQSKLEGAAYFRFFTWLVLATTILFVPFAFFYRPKSYLHD